MSNKKFTVSSFLKAKKENDKISMLTAYDYSTAKVLDDAGVDSILVGDSLGMVMLGYENTLQVTMDDMIHHCKAVSRGTKNAMVIGDMPFLSYHVSVEESVRNAGRLIQEGNVHAVKLEGGSNIIDNVRAIIKAQIPVIGHLGLTPQSVNMFGGFKVQGKNEQKAKQIIEDALLLQEAGVFAIVLECVPEKLSKIITEKLTIPTIGIGAGKYCDGQVLVVQDMLGMYKNFTPKFVKQYANLSESIEGAVKGYIDEIKKGDFPAKEHTFSINDEVLNKIQ
ncbi:3-methyl-2-oxobutanoate hydroxymethyltransferase [Sporosalibacterium faouarense]|uniref:3-methyl-2-oxobutanoate hydroxymethyltransferase n=1 Tax=Sporosalibacterium faouarense TaxID=516123 RepID=UPI00192A9E65|nr:3-methyl-2-oxobutanoate hydroxymethyltransferase [Sporosalibacterium faouarense]